jgi:site-specific DNA-methyltransferase (adenine-specific)
MSIVSNLIECFKTEDFTLEQAYKVNPGVNKESVRARIYEHLHVEFEKLGKGLYIAKDAQCVLIEGNGRDLSFLEDASIDCIITDHPWDDKKANKGGNRNFSKYECFEYTLDDFIEKARVLKDGSFLVEVIPNENESNFDYLYNLKKMAQEAGFEYYCKVPWQKGTFKSNTGRCVKDREDLMIFSKGKARALKWDKQRGLDENGNPTRRMSGTNGMLPAEFSVQPPSKKEQICQSEKPSLLFEQLLEYITLENEIVLDQFAGSGSVGQACINTNRKCILIEKAKDCVDKIVERLGMDKVSVVSSQIA